MKKGENVLKKSENSVEVIKNSKKPSKTEKNLLPREESNPHHPNATLDTVSLSSGAGSNSLRGDFFLVFEGFFKILITFIEFYYF